MEEGALQSKSVNLLVCPACTQPFSMLAWRYRAKLKAGQTRFFCSAPCSAQTIQDKRKQPAKPLHRIECECGKRFSTQTARTLCRSCTAKAAVSLAQQEAARLTLMQHGKVRGDLPREFLIEAKMEWRTRDVTRALRDAGFHVELFKRVSGRTFFFALPDSRQLLDIHDRRYGWSPRGMVENAQQAGWTVVSIRCPVDQPIPVTLVMQALGLKASDETPDSSGSDTAPE